MSNAAAQPHGVMEGGGEYNKHAWIPATGAKLALPFLEQAVRNTALEEGDEPVVVADYGSSQGKNSLAPMRTAIKALRARLDAERPIVVVHIDQPANDFNILFDVLHRDPERYSSDDPQVFPSAIGRSFYERVFPKEYVHLGWSSYAAMWLSRIPVLIPDHFISPASTGEVRSAFERQAADDWKLFLSLRASELRPGGRLVVVLPGPNDDGVSGFEDLFNNANAALAEMVSENLISADERAHMVLGSYPRRRSELLAPFRANGQFCGLTVEHYELAGVSDAAWADYERDADKEVLLARHVGFFRSIFVPSLASGLRNSRNELDFADILAQKLKRRLADQPRPYNSFVQTMVLAQKA